MRSKWWLVTLLLTAPLAALATAITSFTPGTTISSSGMNAAFSALDDRVRALEQKADSTPSLDCYVKGSDSVAWAATCAAGYTLVGGGCNVIDKAGIGINISRPQTASEWDCDARENLAGTSAMCCRILQPVLPAPGSICRGFTFTKQDYVSRTGYNWADSWMMSWAEDDKTYTNFSDGKISDTAAKVSNAILTIDDDLPNLTATSFHAISQNPLGVGSVSTWAHYIISTIFIGQTMYVGMVDFSLNGGIARSSDSGQTLLYNHDAPMWPAGGARVFVYPSFLQNGRGYSGNTDGFMYVYGSDGRWGGSNALRIARVPVTADLLNVANYMYYDGSGWSPDLAKAVNILGPSLDLGGMQSIVYNPVLERYFLISFGNTTNKPGPAYMTVFDAPNPWGPFSACGTIPRQSAIFKDVPNQVDEIYNPSFNAKWIEADGSMWISYASCCEDTQYTFQYGKISITR